MILASIDERHQADCVIIIENIIDACMNVIDKHDPEKMVREPELINHFPHACGRGILADFFLETTDSK